MEKKVPFCNVVDPVQPSHNLIRTKDLEKIVLQMVTYLEKSQNGSQAGRSQEKD
jgi:hypothetical protein